MEFRGRVGLADRAPSSRSIATCALSPRVKFKPIVPRALANRDVDEAIKHYLDQQAGSAALGIVDALEQV